MDLPGGIAIVARLARRCKHDRVSAYSRIDAWRVHGRASAGSANPGRSVSVTGMSAWPGISLDLKPPECVVESASCRAARRSNRAGWAEIREAAPLAAIHRDIDDHATGPCRHDERNTHRIRSGGRDGLLASGTAEVHADLGRHFGLGEVGQRRPHLGALARRPERDGRLGELHGGRRRLARKAHDDRLVGAARPHPAIGFVFRRLLVEACRAGAPRRGTACRRARAGTQAPARPWRRWMTVSANGRTLSASKNVRRTPPGRHALGRAERLGARCDRRGDGDGVHEPERRAGQRVFAQPLTTPTSCARLARARILGVAHLHSVRSPFEGDARRGGEPGRIAPQRVRRRRGAPATDQLERLHRIARGRGRTPRGRRTRRPGPTARTRIGIHRVSTLEPAPGASDVRNAGALVEIGHSGCGRRRDHERLPDASASTGFRAAAGPTRAARRVPPRAEPPCWCPAPPRRPHSSAARCCTPCPASRCRAWRFHRRAS